jgi:hypothetical protein
VLAVVRASAFYFKACGVRRCASQVSRPDLKKLFFGPRGLWFVHASAQVKLLNCERTMAKRMPWGAKILSDCWLSGTMLWFAANNKRQGTSVVNDLLSVIASIRLSRDRLCRTSLRPQVCAGRIE